MLICHHQNSVLIGLSQIKCLKLDDDAFSIDNIVFADIDSNIVTFFSIDTGLNTIHLNNINLDGDNFYNYDPATIIHVRIMGSCNRYEQRKAH